VIEFRTLIVTIVRADKDKLRSDKIVMPIIASNERKALEILRKSCYVGDFVIFPSGKKYRRVKGGFRECTEEDEAELIASTL